MSAKNINSGIDSLRNQAGEPCFFVNWQDADGKHSEFFPNMKMANTFKILLQNHSIISTRYSELTKQ